MYKISVLQLLPGDVKKEMGEEHGTTALTWEYISEGEWK